MFQQDTAASQDPFHLLHGFKLTFRTYIGIMSVRVFMFGGGRNNTQTLHGTATYFYISGWSSWGSMDRQSGLAVPDVSGTMGVQVQLVAAVAPARVPRERMRARAAQERAMQLTSCLGGGCASELGAPSAEDGLVALGGSVPFLPQGRAGFVKRGQLGLCEARDW